ncbi:hypothetical protein EDD16DRAFT_1655468 [Pisolithus croceorrhizus]|nr:hypothetical protein EDD16DRAFT_1655468 [Pisolithus croceorrhizus]
MWWHCALSPFLPVADGYSPCSGCSRSRLRPIATRYQWLWIDGDLRLRPPQVSGATTLLPGSRNHSSPLHVVTFR